MKQTLLTFLFLICIAPFAMAQNGAITGNIVNTKNEPLIGITVIVVTNDTIKQLTDADGVYYLKPITPGKHTLTITSKIHKTIVATDIVVKPDKESYVDLVMVLGKNNDTIKVIGIERKKTEQTQTQPQPPGCGGLGETSGVIATIPHKLSASEIAELNKRRKHLKKFAKPKK